MTAQEPDRETVVRFILDGVPDEWESTVVYLATYVPASEDGSHGFYVLDPKRAPMTYLAGGVATFTDIREGRYCVLAGPDEDSLTPVFNEYGLAAVYAVERGVTTDLGSLCLEKAVCSS